MAEPLVIGLVGMHGSGKTEVGKVLVELGAPYVRMGDVVIAELERRGMEVTGANVGVVANELRQREGLGAVAKHCVPLIEARGKGKRTVIVDGIRGSAEVEEFRKAFGNRFFLLAVWAGKRARYSRVASRCRADDVAGLKAFREKDKRELRWGLGEALTLADALVLNESSLAELRLTSKEIFKAFVGGKREAARRS